MVKLWRTSGQVHADLITFDFEGNLDGNVHLAGIFIAVKVPFSCIYSIGQGSDGLAHS